MVLRDETERQRLQAQLLHSQKLEMLGTLAGSITHDFNNMLAAILGAVEMLELDLEDRSISLGSSEEHTTLIKDVVATASSLTSEVLKFGRKRSLVRERIDARAVVTKVVKLLSHLVKPNIELDYVLDAGEHELLADAGQLQNALLNLGINARDAMAGAGGRLHFGTRSLELGGDDCERSNFELQPGPYLEIEVRDEGTGIAPEVVDKIFEPFFTTKVVGSGTGLGLAAVYEAVIAHRGEVVVESEVGRGTSFRLRLPCPAHTCGESGALEPPTARKRGSARGMSRSK